MFQRIRLDGLTLVGLFFFGFMLMNVLEDRGWLEAGEDLERASAAVAEGFSSSDSITSSAGEIQVVSEVLQTNPQDQDAIAPPYEHYYLTQGPHGFDYGHMAIDLSDGKGALILSPINGRVADRRVDEWGNTILVLENERYIVELLHGLYTVDVGEQVAIGQVIGEESNQGNTFDPAGFSCRGRDCGYHSHLNVYDKSIGGNLNPLDLFPAQQ